MAEEAEHALISGDLEHQEHLAMTSQVLAYLIRVRLVVAEELQTRR